ncbi:EamA family transporter, partial [Camelimonas fluminis]
MSRPILSATTKGILACLLAVTSFGLMFPVMASALKRVDPFSFTSLRYLTAAGASVILLLVKEGPQAFRIRGEPCGRAWLLGSLGFAGFGFFVFLGQQMAGHDGALMTSIMAATQPLERFSIIMVHIRMKRSSSH